MVTVEDEGPGIPEGKLTAIFDRFYTERPAGEKFGTHSGLGLCISKQIVEAHGGEIFARNRHADGGLEEEEYAARSSPYACPATVTIEARHRIRLMMERVEGDPEP